MTGESQELAFKQMRIPDYDVAPLTGLCKLVFQEEITTTPELLTRVLQAYSLPDEESVRLSIMLGFTMGLFLGTHGVDIK